MPRVSADDRLRRLLALVPWVAAHDGPTVEDVCMRFGCTESELVEDLGLLFLCGLYPYTPDVLIETDITDGRVWIRYAEYFSRPLRLTPEGGIQILAGNVEYGQGTNTILAQIAAEACNVDPEWVEVHRPDTSEVPDSGPTVASARRVVSRRTRNSKSPRVPVWNAQRW